jgi:Zn-dependent protease with chaperone function
MTRLLLHALLLLSLALLPACTTNPVTGESEFTLMSEAQELQIGEQYYLPTQQSQGGELRIDPGLSAYVSDVGQRIAAVSDRKLPYEFVVLNSSVPNAWALPGGKIAVNRGLLTALENEAELAAVLGHEVVHAAARHSAQAQTRGMLLQGALIGSMIGAQGSDYANLIMAGASLGAQLITQRYGRDAERESDYYGIEYMVRAGYDPRAAITLQEKFLALAQDQGRNPSWFEGLFLSHPPSAERIENNRQAVAALALEGRDLELGRARYQEALAFLNDAAPAYGPCSMTPIGISRPMTSKRQWRSWNAPADYCRRRHASTACAAISCSSNAATGRPWPATPPHSRRTMPTLPTTSAAGSPMRVSATGSRPARISSAAPACCPPPPRRWNSVTWPSQTAIAPCGEELLPHRRAIRRGGRRTRRDCLHAPRHGGESRCLVPRAYGRRR